VQIEDKYGAFWGWTFFIVVIVGSASVGGIVASILIHYFVKSLLP
jgi:hypothetical protein